MLVESTVCPICEVSDAALFGECDGLNIVRCRRCGLLYVNPRLTKEALRQHYASEYIPTVQVVESGFGSRRESSLQLVANMVQAIKQGGKILDVGCAGGAFLRLFPVNRWERFGVEPSTTAADYARRVNGVNVKEGELRGAVYPDAFFDVISCLDVIFMLGDPVADLKEMHRILADDGILIVEIPGYHFRLLKNTGVVSQLLYGKWIAMNPKELLYYFSDDTMRRLLVKSGFEVCRVSPTIPSLYGGFARQSLLSLYGKFSHALFNVTNHKINLATKVVYIARKAK
jgi:SAM-dependent methyltransferase